MATYHLELRNFPRTLTRFNQSGQQVGAIVLLWVQDKIVQIEDEKWAPYESTITIIEGPAIPIEGLSMGRGWATAKREGTDVTDRVLAEARQALADGSAAAAAQAPMTTAVAPSPPQAASSPSSVPASDSGVAEQASVELEDLLGPEPERLLVAWGAIVARTGGLKPSESLALAERELQRDEPTGS